MRFKGALQMKFDLQIYGDMCIFGSWSYCNWNVAKESVLIICRQLYVSDAVIVSDVIENSSSNRRSRIRYVWRTCYLNA